MTARRSRLAEYERLNGKYLREADELLEKKDLPQASEKLWGAAAEIIKAVAAKRGETLGTHRSLATFLVKLNKEHPELDLMRGFNAAESLHINFYENHLPKEAVETIAQAVRDFVEQLRGLL
ncbi:MAG: PaREP1 family protein [Nitrososphaerales archaeon]